MIETSISDEKKEIRAVTYVDSDDITNYEIENDFQKNQYEFAHGISAFCFSQQGESHKEKDIPCQDRCGMRTINDFIIIAAVADGVGSCELSAYGADVAVNSSLDYLEDYLTKELQTNNFHFDDPYRMGNVLREMMRFALVSVEKKAAEMEKSVYSFQSTLTVAIYDGYTLYFSHAGDDGIIALNAEGTYAMVTSRHKGEEASSVYPLQSKNTWEFGKVDNTVGFVMATDGVLDAVVRPSTEENRVYYPFIEPVFNNIQNDLNDSKIACNDWYEYMASEEYRKIVTDDLSFVGIVNQYGILKSNKPSFNGKEWDRKTKEYEKRREEILYQSENKRKFEKYSKINDDDEKDQGKLTVEKGYVEG